MNVNKIRKDFPILKRKINGKPLIYFDNAATSQKPKQVIRAILDFYTRINSNVHRGVHELSEEATRAYEEARARVASFIKASSCEIVFTRNATEAINLVANVLREQLKPGDEIVLTQMEHHSNLVPWQLLAKQRKLKLRFMRIDEEGKLNYDDLSLIRKRTRVVAFTHVSNVLGTINNAELITKEARSVGAYTIVDGAQSVPHMRVDVRKLGCDFLAFSGHKMLGPTGIGVLYIRKELSEELQPAFLGGGTIVHASSEEFKTTRIPDKWEAGTPNIAGAIGLAKACDYLSSIGIERVHEHERELVKLALELLSEIEGIAIYGPRDPRERCGVVAFNLRGVHPHDVAALLNEHGIAIRSGHHCAQPLASVLGIESSCRASFYLYNTRSEVRRFAKVLATVGEVL